MRISASFSAERMRTAPPQPSSGQISGPRGSNGRRVSPVRTPAKNAAIFSNPLWIPPAPASDATLSSGLRAPLAHSTKWACKCFRFCSSTHPKYPSMTPNTHPPSTAHPASASQPSACLMKTSRNRSKFSAHAAGQWAGSCSMKLRSGRSIVEGSEMLSRCKRKSSRHRHTRLGEFLSFGATVINQVAVPKA